MAFLACRISGLDLGKLAYRNDRKQTEAELKRTHLTFLLSL